VGEVKKVYAGISFIANCPEVQNLWAFGALVDVLHLYASRKQGIHDL